jgi:hypothetical protein
MKPTIISVLKSTVISIIFILSKSMKIPRVKIIVLEVPLRLEKE